MTWKEFFKWALILAFIIAVGLGFLLFIIYLATGDLPPILNKYL
jgi:hypothetical protein